jgi:hypothetical protein
MNSPLKQKGTIKTTHGGRSIFAASDRASDYEAREIHQFLQMFRFPEPAEQEQFGSGTLVPLAAE